MHRLVPNKVYRHFIERTRLGGLHKALLYGAVALLWLSGCAWLLFHDVLTAKGADAGISPMEPLAMKIHGAATMAFIAVFGSLVPMHLRRGWVLRLNRPSGVLITTACLLLMITGWALYYLAGESTRAVVSVVHWVLGLALPLVVVLHILAGRRKLRRETDRHFS